MLEEHILDIWLISLISEFSIEISCHLLYTILDTDLFSYIVWNNYSH
jgi:hypothetical protein